MKDLWLKTINFIFPVTCATCGLPLPYDDYYRICGKCLSKLEMIEKLYCRKCGTALPDGGAHCYSCRKNPGYHFENIRSVCSYNDTSRKLIHKFKYGGRQYLAKITGSLMSEAAQRESYRENVDYIAFVPMHAVKQYFRGYNQAELLAGEVAAATGLPLLNCLKRIKVTKPQYKLEKQQRLDNIRGCFGLRSADKSRIKGKSLLVIDDVCTTCSTVEECAKVLRKGGASKVYILTFARD